MKEIAEIVDNLWLCCYPQEVECCAVGKDISAETRAKLKADIIALIERREKPMREALFEAKIQLKYLDDKPHATTNTVIAKIDSILKEAQNY